VNECGHEWCVVLTLLGVNAASYGMLMFPSDTWAVPLTELDVNFTQVAGKTPRLLEEFVLIIFDNGF